MAADGAGPSNAVVPAAEPEVDLTIHPSGIVPQLQVRGAMLHWPRVAMSRGALTSHGDSAAACQ